MSDKLVVWCHTLPGIDCCGSCHEDWEHGYNDSSEDEVEGVTVYACCGNGCNTEEDFIKAVQKWKGE